MQICWYPRRASDLFIQLFSGLFQRVRELIGTGGLLHAAVDPIQTVNDRVDIHALDESGNPLEVAVAAANELDVSDGSAVNVK